VIPPPARIVSSAACMSTIGNEVSAKPSIEAKVKEDICMIVPGLNVLPYRLRRCLARRRANEPIIAGFHHPRKMSSCEGDGPPNSGFTRVRISLMRKSDKSDLRGQARG
jgi:hypothetical protein